MLFKFYFFILYAELILRHFIAFAVVVTVTVIFFFNPIFLV